MKEKKVFSKHRSERERMKECRVVRLPVLSCVGSSSDQPFWVALDMLQLYPLLQETKQFTERNNKE